MRIHRNGLRFGLSLIFPGKDLKKASYPMKTVYIQNGMDQLSSDEEAKLALLLGLLFTSSRTYKKTLSFPLWLSKDQSIGCESGAL